MTPSETLSALLGNDRPGLPRVGPKEIQALRAAVELAEAVEGMLKHKDAVKANEKGVAGIECHVADVKLYPLERGEWAVEVWSEFDYAEDGPAWFYTGPTPLAALRAADRQAAAEQAGQVNLFNPNQEP